MNGLAVAEKLYDFTEKNGLLQPESRVIVALSGGADSMALLDMLCRWDAFRPHVIAVHINHGIRGDEAMRDERFVRQQCAARGIRLFVVRADVPGIAASEHWGEEEAGRAVRYAVLEKLRASCGADCIATAHTASDQAETLLLHMIRGCGARGLAGMRPKRGRLIRPLLCCTREEIEAYCAARRLPYVTDATNADERYSRNLLRLQILPRMRRINPQADRALLRLSDNLRGDLDYLDRLGLAELRKAERPDGGYDRLVFAAADRAIAVRMLTYALEAIGCRSMEERHVPLILSAVATGHGRVALPLGFSVGVEGDRVRFCRDAAPAAPPADTAVDGLPMDMMIGGRQARLSVVDGDGGQKSGFVHKMFFKYACDYDKILGGLVIRSRRPGDALHPAGRQVGKSVKKLMNEERIPRESRGAYPLVCDENGIVLIPGVCCDERVRPDEHTNHFLVWQWCEKPS